MLTTQDNATNHYEDRLKEINRLLEEQNRLLDQADRKGGKADEYEKTLAIEKEKLATMQEELEAQKAFYEWSVKTLPENNKADRNIKNNILNQMQDALDEADAALEEQKNKIEDLQQEYIDFAAGAITQVDIADAIAQAFEDGKTSVDDFADYTNNILRDAVMNVFKSKILGGALDDAQKYLSDALGDNKLTDDEVSKFKTMTQAIVDNNQQLWNDLTSAMPGLFGAEDAAGKESGLAGAIKGVTEETAGLIAGQMGAIRINAVESLGVVRNIETEIRQININTKELFAIRSILESQNSLTSERALGR